MHCGRQGRLQSANFSGLRSEGKKVKKENRGGTVSVFNQAKPYIQGTGNGKSDPKTVERKVQMKEKKKKKVHP